LLRKFTYIIFVTEREAAAASAVPAPSLDGSTKTGRGGESGRGGRKKYISCPYALLSLVYFPSRLLHICIYLA
jgi:hypothetical protein